MNSNHFETVVQRVRKERVIILGERISRKRPRLHRFNAPAFGYHEVKFTRNDVRRTLFGFAFVRWRGRWRGVGISFINVLMVKVVKDQPR